MSTTTILIGLILAAMLLQYTLAWRQARRFSRDVGALRESAGSRVSVGVAKAKGRRVFVALAAADGRVTGALTMSGATVFAETRPAPALLGRPVEALSRGEATDGLSTLVAAAAQQAAGFVLAGDRESAAA